MLEQRVLLLRPWTAAAAADRRRDIVDPTTGQRLGFAARTLPARTWLCWFPRPVVRVHEEEDESLLLLLQPLWGWVSSWDVRDADGHRVGVARGNLLQDRFGLVLAVVERDAGASGCTFRDPDGVELGTLSFSEEGAVLTFADGVEGNPFAKMLLLAKALDSE